MGRPLIGPPHVRAGNTHSLQTLFFLCELHSSMIPVCPLHKRAIVRNIPRLWKKFSFFFVIISGIHCYPLCFPYGDSMILLTMFIRLEKRMPTDIFSIGQKYTSVGNKRI